MKKNFKFICLLFTLIVLISSITPSAFAKEFAPAISTNIGVNTQYAYSSNDPSWLRQLTIKEDMLSVEGIANAVVLYPVAEYPYTTDAKTFKATVGESIKLYTLDEDSRRAAYLYLLEQIGALSIISDPSATDASKAEWLRQQGIIVTEEDENDPDGILMISALYALMKNDFYYVMKGERLTIPQGTPLEEAVVIYLTAFSDQDSALSSFMARFFGSLSITNLDDYIYYTSLMALYTRGYVSPLEIPTLSREEVYRRVAIMTISAYGIAIDADSATTEEIQEKYLTAMLGTQYKVTLDHPSLLRAIKKKKVPYYILQRMALEDSNLTISQTKYSYEECFDLVCKKTERFDLEDEFYSDIYEYNIYLKNSRKNISINPNPISNGGTSIFIGAKEVAPAEYAVIELNGEEKQTLNIVSRQTTEGKTTTTTYRVNVHQGSTVAPDSNLTGIIPTVGDIFNAETAETVTAQLPSLMPIVDKVNDSLLGVVDGVLSLNDKGQLVDSDGNIIGNGYEALPEGYQYAVGKDGIITVVPVAKNETEPTTDEESELGEEGIRKIVIAVAGACLILLIIAGAFIIKFSKKGKKSKNEKMRKRRDKEKSKKARKEARSSKK